MQCSAVLWCATQCSCGLYLYYTTVWYKLSSWRNFVTWNKRLSDWQQLFLQGATVMTVCSSGDKSRPRVQYTMSPKVFLLYSMLGLAGTEGEGDPLWPCVPGAVLQTPPLLIHSFSQSCSSSRSSKHHNSKTVRARQLEFCENVYTCNISHATCHRSILFCFPQLLKFK